MKSDTLILGNIITLDDKKPRAQAVTVKKGRITYVGSEKTARTLCDADTKVIDYGSSYVYPGFMDAHAHPMIAGGRLALSIDLSGIDNVHAESMDVYVQTVKEYVEKHPGEKIYRGAGWSFIPPGPTAAMLDDACKDVPVYLHSVDGHSMWLNTAAMKECGITKELAKRFTPDQIHVDETGEPTGLLAEMEAIHLTLETTLLTDEEMKTALSTWQDFAFSQGITAVGDAGFTQPTTVLHAIDALIDEGKWKLRTYSSFLLDLKRDIELEIFQVNGIAKFCTDGHFKINAVKLFIDGVIEGHTAWTIDEYKDQPGYRGFCALPEQEKLIDYIKAAEMSGLSVHCHSIGDAAAKFTLDAMEKAQEEMQDYDQRNCLAHLEMVRPEDIKRFGELNVAAIVPPLWVSVNDPQYHFEEQYIGKEATYNAYPIKSFIDAGAVICFHSDYPVSPAISVPHTVYAAVMRKDPGDPVARKPEEGITAYQALCAMTKNIAWLWKEEDNLGTIEIGKIANFSVYDTDFLGDIEKVPDAKLVATIVDGEVVFEG